MDKWWFRVTDLGLFSTEPKWVEHGRKLVIFGNFCQPLQLAFKFGELRAMIRLVIHLALGWMILLMDDDDCFEEFTWLVLR